MYVLKCTHVRIHLCTQVHVLVYTYSILCCTWACAQSLSRVQLFTTFAAHQAPPSMRFPRQEHLSASPSLSPGDLPNLGSTLASTPATCIVKWILYCWATWEAHFMQQLCLNKWSITWNVFNYVLNFPTLSSDTLVAISLPYQVKFSMHPIICWPVLHIKV